MSVMMLMAYCVTSIVLDNQMVNPIAERTVSTATPNGRSAEMIVPKTIPKIMTVSGPEINSALIKSS